ncbi:MAG: trypsin-like serine protease [Rhizobacter sp.]
MNTSRRSLLALGSLAALVATRPAQALMAGASPDTPDARVDANTVNSPWTSAVSVIVNGGAYSGVVIAPRYVLTANHVAGGQAPANVSVQINAQSTPLSLAATAITSFPSASFPYDDLALITLATAAPETVEILPIYRTTPPAHQVITVVGYGWSGNGDVGAKVSKSSGVKRSGSNSIDGVQTSIDSSGRSSLFYLFDFDGPTGNGAFGGATLGNAFETGLASGDSGSPAYATINGQRWLIGINNLVAAAAGASAIDYKFGTLCGGMLLSDARFINWLTAQTQGTLGQGSGNGGDVPLPTWSLGLLATGMAGGAFRRQTRSG